MTSATRTQLNMKLGDELVPGWPLKTIEQGADTLMYLALLPPNGMGPRGEFVAERKGKNVGANSQKPNFQTVLLLLSCGLEKLPFS